MKWKEYLKSQTFRELICYAVVGALTTLVNLAAYWLFMLPFGDAPSDAAVTVGICVAWVLSVAFAYVANKRYVFRTHLKTREALLREMGEFTAARLLSLGFDVVFVLAMVNLLHMDDFIAKAISNVVVIILNYAASKLWIFKKRA